jgi:rubrerythrin
MKKLKMLLLLAAAGAIYALAHVTTSDAASVVGTKTEQNLLTAFANESMARDKYDFYASRANSDGYQSAGKIFTETAAMEKEHGELFFKFLESSDRMMPIAGAYPAGKIGTTLENLEEAATGEHNENTKMYIDMAADARAEGFDEIAGHFENIANAEKYHESRFVLLAENIRGGTYFTRADPVTWKCTNCGFHTTGRNAPDKCPACDHDRGYFIEARREYL